MPGSVQYFYFSYSTQHLSCLVWTCVFSIFPVHDVQLKFPMEFIYKKQWKKAMCKQYHWFWRVINKLIPLQALSEHIDYHIDFPMIN